MALHIWILITITYVVFSKCKIDNNWLCITLVTVIGVFFSCSGQASNFLDRQVKWLTGLCDFILFFWLQFLCLLWCQRWKSCSGDNWQLSDQVEIASIFSLEELFADFAHLNCCSWDYILILCFAWWELICTANYCSLTSMSGCPVSVDNLKCYFPFEC